MSTSSPVCLVGVGGSEILSCWELLNDFFVEYHELYIDEFLIQRGVYTQATSVVGTLQVVRRDFVTVNSSSRHL